MTTSGGSSRLRRVAKECQNYGQRVQYSIFECVVNPAQWTVFKNKLESIIDKRTDSLRYYYLGANYKKKVEHFGAKPSIDMDGPVII